MSRASAEVSVGTASRVINGKATVGTEVRGRVLTLSRRCVTAGRDSAEHAPGIDARDRLRDPRHQHSVAGSLRPCRAQRPGRAGFSLLLSNSEGREDRERELLIRLNSQRSDGIK